MKNEGQISISRIKIPLEMCFLKKFQKILKWGKKNLEGVGVELSPTFWWDFFVLLRYASRRKLAG